jgi:hypothetical protein
MRARRYNLATALGLVHLIRIHLLVFGVGLLMLACSLQWEPQQWASPIYGILFAWFEPSTWAAILVVLGVLKLIACLIYPRLVPLALTLGNVFFVAWTVSFTFAYFDRALAPVSPLLAMLGAFVVGEHIAVASLLQREKTISSDGKAHP